MQKGARLGELCGQPPEAQMFGAMAEQQRYMIEASSIVLLPRIT